MAKTKALISSAKLICVFVFAYADCWFSHAAAHNTVVSFMSSEGQIKRTRDLLKALLHVLSM